MTLGSKLKTMRQAKNLSQSQVAEKLHLSRQTVSKWELEKSIPDLESLKMLAILYDFSLDELFNLAKEKEDNMTYLTEEALLSLMIKKISEKETSSPEKVQFLLANVIQPLKEKMQLEKVYYFALQKQVSSILIHEPVKTTLAKEYLQLFLDDASDFYFFTGEGIIYCNIISFLQEKSLNFYPYERLKYLCVGRLYDKISIKEHNSPALGIYANDRSFYNHLQIKKEDLPPLIYFFTHLQKTQDKFFLLEDFGLFTFHRKWEKKQF